MHRHPRSPHRPTLVLAGAFVAVALSTAVWAALPKPAGYISDFANLLPESTKTELHALVKEVREQTSAEITVVTIESLEGMPIEDYAVQLFKEWGIGKKGTDTGVLLLVAKADRKVRIEVGYGLEPILPDALTISILRTEVTPAFKQGDYPRGITQGVRRIADVVRAKHVLTPEERARLLDESEGRPPTYVTTPFFGLFVAIGCFVLGAGIRARSSFPLLFGGLFSGIPMLMALVPFFNASMFVLVPVALGMALWGYSKGASPAWQMNMQKSGSSVNRSSRWGATTSGSSSSSWSSSSSDSSSSSSGSDSSSDSFGGGSSGGGGASDSW